MASFPKDFLWGVATSAYQIEGSPLADGAGPSIWHRFAHTPGTIADGTTADVACDHYHRWREDVALMAGLGVRAYRFSIAWPRILPDGDGKVNAAGLAFYDGLVDALLEAGIEPLVTLYHWDLPGALQDRGGWANRHSVGWFTRYAAVVADALGDRVGRWITVNEPWVVAHLGHVEGVNAPGQRDLTAGLLVAHHLLLAHGAAVTTLRERRPGAKVGIALNLTPHDPASERPEDVAATRRSNAYINDLFLGPLTGKGYPDDLREWFGPAFPKVTDGDLSLMATPTDFLGVNYYMRRTVEHAPGEGVLAARHVTPEGPVTALGWEIHPPGLVATLEDLRDRWGNPRVLITENGAAVEDVPGPDGTVDDPVRLAYLRDHVAAVARARSTGCDVGGYFVWSLLDNVEWAAGFFPRFGLVAVDPLTQERRVKRSGRWYARLVERNGEPEEGQ